MGTCAIAPYAILLLNWLKCEGQEWTLRPYSLVWTPYRHMQWVTALEEEISDAACALLTTFKVDGELCNGRNLTNRSSHL